MSVHTSQPRPPSPVPKAMPMRNAVGCSLQVQVCPRGGARALHTQCKVHFLATPV